jgi:hypothetical protein
MLRKFHNFEVDPPKECKVGATKGDKIYVYRKKSLICTHAIQVFVESLTIATMILVTYTQVTVKDYRPTLIFTGLAEFLCLLRMNVQ